jgi:hypothetical protein
MSSTITSEIENVVSAQVKLDGQGSNVKAVVRSAQRKGSSFMFLSSGVGARLSAAECEEMIKFFAGSVSRRDMSDDERAAIATHLSLGLSVTPAFAAAARCFIVLIPADAYRAAVEASLQVSSPTGEQTVAHSDFRVLKKANIAIPLVIATDKAVVYEKANLAVLSFIAPRVDADLVVGSVATVKVNFAV